MSTSTTISPARIVSRKRIRRDRIKTSRNCLRGCCTPMKCHLPLGSCQGRASMPPPLAAPEIEDALIPLSALQHHLFCPRQCALIHVEGLWAEDGATAEGRIPAGDGCGGWRGPASISASGCRTRFSNARSIRGNGRRCAPASWLRSILGRTVSAFTGSEPRAADGSSMSAPSPPSISTDRSCSDSGPCARTRSSHATFRGIALSLTRCYGTGSQPPRREWAPF